LERVDQHLTEYFPGAFTGKVKDWTIFFHLDGLGYQQARKVEAHIKRMKSKRFIENLKTYPEISSRLITLYQ
jgi:putative endonuclease